MNLRHGERNIATKRTIQYLDMWLDDNLIFGKHVKNAREKAEKCQTALVRQMPNVGGLRYVKRVGWHLSGM